jgi:type I restriction enzyme S subunit
VTIQRGGSPRPIDKYITHDPNGINWIKIGDVSTDAKYINSTEDKIRPEGAAKSRWVYPGDFILSNSMSFGRPYICSITGCIHDGWLLIRDEKKLFDKEFLVQALSSESMMSQYRSLAAGSTVNNLNKELVSSTKIIYPEKAEQKLLGDSLGKIDSLLVLHQRKLEKLKSLKKSLLQQMFPREGEDRPRVRFAGFADAWEQRKLCDVVDVQSGMDYKHLASGTIPVYGTGGYMLSVNKALSYDRDAIGIGRKGTIDKPYVLKAPFWTVDTLFYCLPKEGFNLDFVNCLFQKVNWKSKDESTGVPSLSKTTINSIGIQSCSLDEQNKIGALYRGFEESIVLHQRELDKLILLKKALLQKMLM